MEERYTEIRFYYFMQKLMKTFNYSATILDIVEAYCNIGEIDSMVIKKLIGQIRQESGPINTYKEELCYIARELNVSYRDVYKMAGIALSTQQRINKYLDTHGLLYQGIVKHLPEEEYIQVKRFMRVVDILKEM